MAIDLPNKKYYTFIELAKRFQCSELDLRCFVIEQKIIPSIYLDLKFYDNYRLASHEYNDVRHYWPEIYCNESKHKILDHQTALEGFHFLIYPTRESAAGCFFEYCSKTANYDDEFNICYLLHKSCELDFVMESGVVMASELARFEAINTVMVEVRKEEKPIQERERSGLLNIIAAMNELLQSPKPNRVSDTAVIDELVANYSDKYGISTSNLQKQFAAAKRSLRAN